MHVCQVWVWQIYIKIEQWNCWKSCWWVHHAVYVKSKHFHTTEDYILLSTHSHLKVCTSICVWFRNQSLKGEFVLHLAQDIRGMIILCNCVSISYHLQTMMMFSGRECSVSYPMYFHAAAWHVKVLQLATPGLSKPAKIFYIDFFKIIQIFTTHNYATNPIIKYWYYQCACKCRHKPLLNIF